MFPCPHPPHPPDMINPDPSGGSPRGTPGGMPQGDPLHAEYINWGTTGTEPSQITHQLLPHITLDSTIRAGTVDVSFEAYLGTPPRSNRNPTRKRWSTRPRHIGVSLAHKLCDKQYWAQHFRCFGKCQQGLGVHEHNVPIDKLMG